MNYRAPCEDKIQREVRVMFSKLSNGYTLDKMSYEDASAHYGIEYDDLYDFSSFGTKKRLMFFEDDWQIEKYLSEVGYGSIDFVKLSSLYPKQKLILQNSRSSVNMVYAPIFESEEDCMNFLIKTRWDGKPICPHCGCEKSYKIENGKRFKCGNSNCHKKYSVTTGTIFSGSNLPYTKLVAAIYIGLSDNIDISSIKLADVLKTTQKTAWVILDDLRKNKDDEFIRKIRYSCLKQSLRNIGTIDITKIQEHNNTNLDLHNNMRNIMYK